jgi:hypothetical protein
VRVSVSPCTPLPGGVTLHAKVFPYLLKQYLLKLIRIYSTMKCTDGWYCFFHNANSNNAAPKETAKLPLLMISAPNKALALPTGGQVATTRKEGNFPTRQHKFLETGFFSFTDCLYLFLGVWQPSCILLKYDSTNFPICHVRNKRAAPRFKWRAGRNNECRGYSELS